MATPVRVTAAYVAKSFGEQYYKILVDEPSKIHQFYLHESRVVRIDGDNINTALGITKISELLKSLNFVRITIEKVNSATWNGNVVVLLLGLVEIRGIIGMRKFVQTVTLIPLDKSFYVLNDVFQFLDDIVRVPNLAAKSLIIIDE